VGQLNGLQNRRLSAAVRAASTLNAPNSMTVSSKLLKRRRVSRFRCNGRGLVAAKVIGDAPASTSVRIKSWVADSSGASGSSLTSNSVSCFVCSFTLPPHDSSEWAIPVRADNDWPVMQLVEHVGCRWRSESRKASCGRRDFATSAAWHDAHGEDFTKCDSGSACAARRTPEAWPGRRAMFVSARLSQPRSGGPYEVFWLWTGSTTAKASRIALR
jgi:phage-related tail fiber protein